MTLYDIPMDEMTEAFSHCWRAAGLHLQQQSQDGIRSWLRAHPWPPFLEHLSFRLGNQLLFIRVEDVDRRVRGPGTLEGLYKIAREMRGHACLLPMRQGRDGRWHAELPGWGLIEAHSQRRIDPLTLVSDERIEMTDWELLDLGVQVVRDHLADQGYELMSWQSNPQVDPSIWFVNREGERQWVVVRVARYPAPFPERPANWQAIQDRCGYMGTTGHFAPLVVRSAEQAMPPPDEPTIPLWRGYGMEVDFGGVG